MAAAGAGWSKRRVKRSRRSGEFAMVIQGAFMHVNGSVSAERFLRFLALEVPAGKYFVAEPPPGIIMTAAIDWRVIVPDAARLEALANALWSGYESMVQPARNAGAPLILLQIKNASGEWDQFTIGKDVAKKEAFLHRVRETAAVLSSRDQESAVRRELEKTLESDYWLEIR